MADADHTFIVTGGCGFIGSNLAAELQRRVRGCHVLVVDSMRTGTFANLISASERRGDVFRGEVFAEPIAAVDWIELIDALEPAAVFHLGAITDTTGADEAEMIEENAGIAWRAMMLACAHAAVPLVYASSAATYGSPPEARDRVPFREASAGKPNNVYGFSKWLMEQAHRRFAAEQLAEGDEEPWIVGLRYFNVFGPGEAAKGKMASMACQLAQQMLAGERPKLFEHGEQARDQVSVDDIVGVTLAAAGLGERTDPRPGVYNAGSGRSTTFEELASAVRSGLGSADADRPTEYIPMPASIRRFYQDFTCADMSAAETGLGFKPACDPAEAIAKYARWMADNHDAG